MGTTRSVHGAWYLVAVIPAAIGTAIAINIVRDLVDQIDELPRAVVPGTGDVALEAGDYVVYGERESVHDGVAYRSPSLQLRCGMQALPDPTTGAGGESVPLNAPSTRVSYGFGGYSGQSMFAVTIPHAGPYRVHCEGSGGPATLAFGIGIGARILNFVSAILVAAFGTIATIVVVRVLRRRAARAVQGRTAAPDAASV